MKFIPSLINSDLLKFLIKIGNCFIKIFKVYNIKFFFIHSKFKSSNIV